MGGGLHGRGPPAEQCSWHVQAARRVTVIRVLVVDDHPAVVAGLVAILDREVGIAPRGAAQSVHEAVDEVRRLRPDLVLTDFQLLDGDGLTLCRRLKVLNRPPRVLLYSAYSTEGLAPAVLLAGAEGIVGKATPVADLLDAIRLAARGELVLPQLPQRILAQASGHLDAADLPIFGMRVAHTPTAEIATTLGLTADEVEWKIDLMLASLKRNLAGASNGGTRSYSEAEHSMTVGEA